MNNLLQRLTDLLKVKTLVTLVVVVVFAVLALTNRLPADSVMVIVTMVIGFYFGTQHEKRRATPDE